MSKASARARTVLITGGTGALGTQVSTRFLQEGDTVAATWITERHADALAQKLGRFGNRLHLLEADVTDAGSVASVVDEVVIRLGPIDVLVHLVGGWQGEPMHRHSLETWDRMMQLNLRSTFLCSRAVLPSMRERGWGRLVFVSSRAARSDREGQAAYAVAKAGVAVLAEAIAEENRGLDVTANVVAPSILDTPANRAAMPDADHASLVAPSAVAAAIAFLASEDAGQLRGAWLPVYGSA